MKVIKRGSLLPVFIFDCSGCGSTLEAVEGELNDVGPFENEAVKEKVFFCPVCRTYRSIWTDKIKSGKGGSEDD